mgnify:CR=1 FL=1
MTPEKINIAIIGFGNIGSYFYKILEKNKINIFTKTGKVPFVKYISAKNLNKKRQIKIPKSKWIKNPLNIPLIGIGGITSGSDVLEYVLAGAGAVQVGTANYRDPDMGKSIIEELNTLLDQKNKPVIAELVGKLQLGEWTGISF